MLVFKGTPKPLSNRMIEDASELKPCLNKTFNVEFSDAIASENLDHIYEVISQFNQAGINVVGSRGYVYSSEKLAELLKCVIDGAFINLSVFPRTGGLRKSISNAINKVGEK